MSGIVHGVCGLLAGAGVGAYSPTAALPVGQTPITIMAMPPAGDLAVCVTTYGGGPEPDSTNGWEYPRLQVRVRATNPLDALDLDRAAYNALQAAQGPLPDSGWVLQDAYALQSEPTPLGPDDNGRHEYVRNYQLTAELAEQ